MLFSSLIFLCLFLPLFLAIYFLTGKGQRNQVLLFGSLIFYTWGEGRLVALLLLSLILGVGMSWAHLRRMFSGQLSVDDVED